MTNTPGKEIKKDPRIRDSRNRSRYYLRPSKVFSFISAVQQRVIEDEDNTSSRKVSRNRKNPFTKLPEEMVIKILAHLNVKELNLIISPVCRKWFLYSRHPALWRELKFEGDAVPSKEVIRLLQLAPELKHLEISNRSDTKVLLEEVCQRNRKLERIIVRQNYRPLSRLSPYAINFSTCPSDFDWKSVASIFMDNNAYFMPCEIEDNSQIPSRVLLKVLKACRCLNSVTLTGVEIRSRLFFEILTQLPKLQSIDLTVGNRPGALNWVVSLLNSHLGEGSHSPPLYFRALYNWFNSDNKGNTPSHMHLTHSPHILRFLASSLIVLDVDAIAMSEDMFDEFMKCTSLQALHLYNAVNITSSVFIKMLSQLPHLMSLKVNQAYRLRSAVLISALYTYMNIIKGSDKRKSQLKYLSMTECPAIDDASIHAIASRNPQMEHLSLAQCHRLTDEGLRCVLYFCHRLR
ncbi:F-box and leucine-rich repeat protein 13-like [Hetaerina americana]|uniref:F-box and leucine-rich repeat protein 13-like n=1 Tax=Hetaerina americana TaxID=62018 RepID=UPI003A7F27F7